MQNLGLGGLWVAEIHHLIEKFVDDDVVVAYALLLELLEVFGKDLDDPVEEKEDLCGIAVSLCYGQEVEVVVTDIQILQTVRPLLAVKKARSVNKH